MRLHYNNYKLLTLLLLFTCFLISCKSKKQLITNENVVITEDNIFQQLIHPIHPNWVNAKAKAKISSLYGSDKGQLYLRMKKDSIVWSAVKRLSIEGGRAQINKDSAYFINRLDKTWSGLSLEGLQNKYGLVPDLNYIQHMLTGIPPQIDTLRFFEKEEDNDYFHITSDIQGVLHVFTFDKSNGFLVRGKFETQFGLDGEWAFSDFRQCVSQDGNTGVILPFKRNYNLNLGPDETLVLELNFSEIELDIAKSIKFEIPDHYIKN